MWPFAVELDGVSVDLADVAADVVIHHGRVELTDDPTASTCQLTMLGVPPGFARDTFDIGARLVVLADPGELGGPPVPRFTGRVTDAALEVDSLTVVAAGTLSTLGQYKIGAAPWPVERWSERVTRAFREAGLTPTNLHPNGDFETDVAGWGTNESTLTRSTAEHHTGAASLYIAPPAGSGGSAYSNLSPAGLIPGRQYRYRAWIKGTAGVQTVLQAYVSDFASGLSDVRTATGEWVYHEVVFVQPAAPLFIYTYAGTYGDQPVYVDSLEVVDAASPDVLELHAPTFDPMLAARDPATAGPVTLRDYLGFLAPMVGAAVVDLPNGRVLVQPLDSRRLDAAVALDPADVAYAPPWVQILPPGNVVTVRYTGDQSESVTARDDSSVAIYGERPRTIDTTFVDAVDAATRASSALARGAYSHWNITAAPLIRPALLELGAPVTLTGMPPASPYDPWTPILEGWSDAIDGADWTMTLALSDPLGSGLALPWESVPPAELWNTIDQAIPWRDAFALADLIE